MREIIAQYFCQFHVVCCNVVWNWFTRLRKGHIDLLREMSLSPNFRLHRYMYVFATSLGLRQSIKVNKIFRSCKDNTHYNQQSWYFWRALIGIFITMQHDRSGSLYLVSLLWFLHEPKHVIDFKSCSFHLNQREANDRFTTFFKHRTFQKPPACP